MLGSDAGALSAARDPREEPKHLYQTEGLAIFPPPQISKKRGKAGAKRYGRRRGREAEKGERRE